MTQSDEKIIEALEKADKYRWHDLRKDPNDLPEKDGKYSVNVLACFNGMVHESAYCYEDAPMFTGHINGESFIKDVVRKGKWISHQTEIVPIAWKYIEPFEED